MDVQGKRSEDGHTLAHSAELSSTSPRAQAAAAGTGTAAQRKRMHKSRAAAGASRGEGCEGAGGPRAVRKAPAEKHIVRGGSRASAKDGGVAPTQGGRRDRNVTCRNGSG